MHLLLKVSQWCTIKNSAPAVKININYSDININNYDFFQEKVKT